MKESTINLITKHGEPFEIPEGGSLGLLALGYIGVMLWREKRKEIQMKNQMKKTE
jgi:hypothetical protein